MKKTYSTNSGIRFSFGTSTEPKLKLIAKIILFICLIVLIATKSFSQFY